MNAPNYVLSSTPLMSAGGSAAQQQQELAAQQAQQAYMSQARAAALRDRQQEVARQAAGRGRDSAPDLSLAVRVLPSCLRTGLPCVVD